MENIRINVGELLKDCPSGMELDCTLFDNVTFISVVECDKQINGIRIKTGDNFYHLTKFGTCISDKNAKCVIFPKGKNSWEGFQRPFKDGDIVATDMGHWIGITEGGKKDSFIPTYCVLKSNGQFEVYFDEKRKWCFYRLATEEEKAKLFQAIKDNGYKWNEETKTLVKLIEPNFKDGDVVVTNLGSIGIISKKLNNGFYETHCLLRGCDMTRNVCAYVERLATEEEKAKLFQAIKDNGYKWNSDTKTLEELIEPKFKVGDKIRLKNNRHITAVIVDITENQYVLSSCDQRYLDFKYQDKFELVPNKFDFLLLYLLKVKY